MNKSIYDIKKEECYSQNRPNGTFGPQEKFCQLFFDGLLCWTATKAGVEAKQPCPTYLMESKEYATRKCELNGQWFVKSSTNSTWTDYTKCWNLIDNETALVDIDWVVKSDLYSTWFPILKNVSHWGYGISLATSILAMIIFMSIKKLQCARNRLHMHLITSFIMRAFMSLLKDYLFVYGIAMSSDLVFVNGKPQYIKEHHNWICKVIISARNYFIIANYILVLMEGIYLHNLMFLKLFSDNNHITVYYIVGWGLPFLFIIPWVIMRVYYEDTLCWTTSKNHHYSMLIEVPIALSVIINFVLFITIVRVLFIKLNSIYLQQRKIKYRRLTRSTLTLVPLFGVPYTISLIISYSSTTNRTVELIWLFFDQTFIAFQGCFAAVVYCLMNSEVHTALKHKFSSISYNRKYFRGSRERTISHTTQLPATVLPMQEYICETVMK